MLLKISGMYHSSGNN